MKDEFPLALGVPMHLLTGRGLEAAFFDVFERYRREGLPVVIRAEGRVPQLPVELAFTQISPARNRIAELTAEIAKCEYSPFSVHE
jgi:hypothetical protein